MFTMKLTAEQRLQKAVSRILHEDRYKPLAGILMLGNRSISETCPTAATNGRDEWYGRAFVEGLSDAELRFVIIHEAYHKMYRHLITWRHLWKQNARKANMAMDYVINLKISDENTDEFCKMPRKDGKVVGLIDEKYRNMDTAQVYKLLPDDPDQDPSDGDGDGQGGQSSDNSGGQGQGSSQGFDEHDWDGAQDMDAEEQRQLEQEIDNAIRQGATMAGKMGLDKDRAFDELLEVQVDWREVLREFITSTCAGKDFSTWRRPNRRFMGAGVYMPSAISERVDELVIAVDTSGSIGQLELTTFLTEVVAICEHVKPEKIRLLYWGTSVVGDEAYEEKDYATLAQSTKPRGGGGTDVECVPAYMKDKGIKPQAAIVLTDGYLYGGWGQWSCPVLWTIMDNRDALPTCGKAVHIKSDNL